jgi:hypothetical protein
MKVAGLSIIVQGPIYKNSPCLDYIEHYQKFGKVYISCYKNNLKGIEQLDENFENLQIYGNPHDGEFIDQWFENDLEENFFYHDSTFIWALYSMWSVLKHVKSLYTLKVRTDEGFEITDDFIDEFLEESNKVLCGNIFYKPEEQLHMGDHMFIGRTRILRNAVDNIFHMYSQKKTVDNRRGESYSIPKDPTLCETTKGNCAEAILARAICREINKEFVTYSKSEEQEFFLKNIKHYDINKFGRFVARWNHNDITFTNQFDWERYCLKKYGKLK